MPPPPPPGFVLDNGGAPPPPPGFTLDQPGGGPPVSYSVDPQGNVLRNGAIAYGPDSEAALSETAQAGKVVPAILAGGMGLGAAELVPGGAAALKIATSPLGAAALGGALDFMATRNPLSAARTAIGDGLLAYAGGPIAGRIMEKVGVSRALTARLLHTLGRTAAAEAPAVAEAAPAVEAAYRGIPSLMKIGSSAPEDLAAATQAARAAQGAQDVAGVMKAAPRVMTAPAAMPPTGGGAAGYVQGLSEAAQAAPEAGAVAEDALTTRLRASALLKSNPTALANELEGKVLSLKTGAGKGLSAPQLATVIEEQYGIPAGPAEKMVNMIFQTHGLK